MTTRTPHESVKEIFIPGTTIANPSKSLIVIGSRQSGDGTNFNTLVPSAGYSVIDPYTVTPLQAFKSGRAALAWMKSCGFRVGYGNSFSVIGSVPDSVTTTTLTWNTPQIFLSELANSNYIVNVIQTTSNATGTIFSINSTYTSITLSNVTGTFVTTSGNTLTFNVVDLSIESPDESLTDNICMYLYRVFEALKTTTPDVINTIVPQISMIILDNKTVDFKANQNNISLATSTSVVKVSDLIYNIYWDTMPNNAGYIPSNGWGASTLTGLTSSEVFTLVKKVSPLVYGGLGIQVSVAAIPATAPAAEAYTLKMDTSLDVFDVIRPNQLSSGGITPAVINVVSPYEYSTESDLSSGKMLQLTDFLTSANGNLAVNNGFYMVKGFIGNTTTYRSALGTLPILDGRSFDAKYIISCFYPYHASDFAVKLQTGELVSSMAAICSMIDVNYPPLKGLIPYGLPTSDNPNDWLQEDATGDSENVLQRGWSPIVINTNKSPAIVRIINAMLKYPGTSIEAIELIDEGDYDIIGLLRYNVYLQASKHYNERLSNSILTNMRNDIIVILKQFETNQMLENVDSWLTDLTVSRSTTNPSRAVIVVPAEIIPNYMGSDITIELQSALNASVTNA